MKGMQSRTAEGAVVAAPAAGFRAISGFDIGIQVVGRAAGLQKSLVIALHF